MKAGLWKLFQSSYPVNVFLNLTDLSISKHSVKFYSKNGTLSNKLNDFHKYNVAG